MLNPHQERGLHLDPRQRTAPCSIRTTRPRFSGADHGNPWPDGTSLHDRINNVHYRNVRVRKPYEKYTEVFIDEGENSKFAVLREPIRTNTPA